MLKHSISHYGSTGTPLQTTQHPLTSSSHSGDTSHHLHHSTVVDPTRFIEGPPPHHTPYQPPLHQQHHHQPQHSHSKSMHQKMHKKLRTWSRSNVDCCNKNRLLGTILSKHTQLTTIFGLVANISGHDKRWFNQRISPQTTSQWKYLLFPWTTPTSSSATK